MHYENIYDKCFESVKSIFGLYCDPKYTYPIPSSRSLSLYFRSLTREEKVSAVPRSSLDTSAPGPSHMSGKSQRLSLPPGKEILRMKTVKTVLLINFFLEGFKPLKTSSGKKCK